MKPIRIIFVEDVATDVELAKRELEKEGFAVTSTRVDTGEGLKKALTGFPCDLVVSDYSMPLFDGLSALNMVLEFDPELPVIIFTGSQNEPVAVSCMKRGAADYVLKDNLARLSFAVRDALETKRLQLENKVTQQERQRLTQEATRRNRELESLNAVLTDARNASLNIMEDLMDEIRARRQSEEDLVKSENKFRGIAEQMTDVIFMTDTKGKVLYVSPVVEEVSGYRPEELTGKHFERVVDTRMLSLAKDRYRQALTSGVGDKGLILMLKRKDGSRFPAEIHATVYREGETITGTLGTLRDITDRLKAEEELKESHQRLRDLTTHIQELREEERKEISQNLHDDLGQKLTALNIDLAWLARRIPDNLPELAEKINGMHHLLLETVTRVKQISSELRPSILDDLGITAALHWQANDFFSRTGIRCEVVVIPEELVMPPEKSTQVYRIVQEALTNIMRHAEATQVRISLTKRKGTWRLAVKDNGAGFRVDRIDRKRSFGLMGMEDRSELCGGTFRIRSVPGTGTEIQVAIPISEK